MLQIDNNVANNMEINDTNVLMLFLNIQQFDSPLRKYFIKMLKTNFQSISALSAF